MIIKIFMRPKMSHFKQIDVYCFFIGIYYFWMEFVK